MVRGFFVAIDGQHGTGKTFALKLIAQYIASHGYSVATTGEPTNSDIGVLARCSEQKLLGKSLACLFAADRHNHCKLLTEKLAQYDVVISDRYLVSGLVLQNMDGVDFEYIMAINNGVIVPDLQIVVYADKKIIEQRSAAKEVTRLAKQELAETYDRYRHFQTELEVIVGKIEYMQNNTIADAENIARLILGLLENRGSGREDN